MDQLIDFSNPEFVKALICIAINPLYWNTVAQIEYYTHSVSKVFCSSKKLSVTILATTIILLNILRTYQFEEAIKAQPKFSPDFIILTYIGYFLILLGQFFTLTSFYQLGFYATFLADHFGLFIHDAPITSFPFNFMSDPMYWGSTISYLGIALTQSSPAGLILTLWVAIVYKLAIIQESKMLNLIYSKKQG